MLVTAINKPYLPGLKVLNNSIRKNSPNLSLTAIVYGDDNLIDEVSDLGLNVIPNPKINATLPVSARFPVASRAMYARLIVPELMGCDAVWMDVDQVVLKPLDELLKLDLGKKALAAVPNRPMDKSRLAGCPKSLLGVDGILSGLMVLNYKNWTEQRITERCFELMNNPPHGIHFTFIVQSVLEYLLHGNFYRLHEKWQWFPNRGPARPANAMVAHWHGKLAPWRDKVKHAEIWNAYT